MGGEAGRQGGREPVVPWQASILVQGPEEGSEEATQGGCQHEAGEVEDV